MNLFATYPVVTLVDGKKVVQNVDHYSRAQAEGFMKKEGFEVLEGENAGWVMYTKGSQIKRFDCLDNVDPSNGWSLVVDTITVVEWEKELSFGSRAPSRFLLTFLDSDKKMLVSANKRYKLLCREEAVH